MAALSGWSARQTRSAMKVDPSHPYYSTNGKSPEELRLEMARKTADHEPYIQAGFEIMDECWNKQAATAEEDRKLNQDRITNARSPHPITIGEALRRNFQEQGEGCRARAEADRPGREGQAGQPAAQAAQPFRKS